MFDKLSIILFKPKLIAKFFAERLHKSILLFLLFSLIASLPLTAQLIKKDVVSDECYHLVSDVFMVSGKEIDLKYEHKELTGKGIIFDASEAIIFLNPKEEKYNQSINLIPIITFHKDYVDVSIGSFNVYKKTYAELNFKDVDFTKIANRSYAELDKFIYNINIIYHDLHPLYVTSYTILNFLFNFITIMLVSFITAIFSQLYKPMLPFRFRFKVALDSQIPTLIGLFVSAMFNVEFPIWIGTIVSLFVTFIALKALVPVRIDTKKEGE